MLTLKTHSGFYDLFFNLSPTYVNNDRSIYLPSTKIKSTQNTFIVINIITHITYTNYRNVQIIMSLYIKQMWPSGLGRWTQGFAIGLVVYQCCEL